MPGGERRGDSVEEPKASLLFSRLAFAHRLFGAFFALILLRQQDRLDFPSGTGYLDVSFQPGSRSFVLLRSTYRSFALFNPTTDVLETVWSK